MRGKWLVYWLFDDSCRDRRRHGCIGATKSTRLYTRLNQHNRSKRIPKPFDYKVIFCGSRKEALALEAKLRPRPYIGWNMGVGGFANGRGCRGIPKPEAHKRAIAKAHIGIRPSKKTKAKISANRKGKGLGNQNAKGLKHTKAQRAKWSRQRKGNQYWKYRKPYSEEALLKMSEASKKRWSVRLR